MRHRVPRMSECSTDQKTWRVRSTTRAILAGAVLLIGFASSGGEASAVARRPHTGFSAMQQRSYEVDYTPPVNAPVSDGFDDSAGQYGPGNRGLDYSVTPGTAVRSIGEGTVVFAGSVAGSLWVTILHPDGLRSSYGPLATIAVAVGTRVDAASTIGTTAMLLHLGVRNGERYIDPALLFVARPRHARLVPVQR